MPHRRYGLPVLEPVCSRGRRNIQPAITKLQPLLGGQKIKMPAAGLCTRFSTRANARQVPGAQWLAAHQHVILGLKFVAN